MIAVKSKVKLEISFLLFAVKMKDIKFFHIFAIECLWMFKKDRIGVTAEWEDRGVQRDKDCG